MEYKKIDQIKPYERNAKEHPQKQVEQIANSIKAFGFNQPLVVDKNNVIIVGHGRYYAALLLGLDEVPCLQVDLTEEQAKAYRLADNKLNESKWEMGLVLDELKTLSLEMVELTGFDLPEELQMETRPEIEFTEELMEEHNYLVLYFDNQIDWLNLLSIYPLKTVKALGSKKNYKKIGVGRVVKGSDFLNAIIK